MKFGFRTPSLKKRIAARTSWKRVARHNLGLKAPRGFGWLTNPKKAAYNRVYNRTTIGCGTMIYVVLLVMIVAALTVYASGQTGHVIAERANLRGTPNQNGKIIVEAGRGDEFEVVKRSSAWYLIQTSEYVGWIHGNTIELDVQTLGGTTEVPNYGGYPIIVPKPPTTPRQVVAPRPVTNSGGGRSYFRGPRGGCYYINGNGNKTYVSHSYCG